VALFGDAGRSHLKRAALCVAFAVIPACAQAENIAENRIAARDRLDSTENMSGAGRAATGWYVVRRGATDRSAALRLGTDIGGHAICGTAGIAFLAHDGGRSGLWYLDLQSGRRTLVARGAFDQPRACSPDGRFILHDHSPDCPSAGSCHDDDPDAAREMRLVDRRTGRAAILPDMLTDAAWDADGRHLLYADMACHDPAARPVRLSAPDGSWQAIRHCPADRLGGQWRGVAPGAWVIVREGRAVTGFRLTGGRIEEGPAAIAVQQASLPDRAVPAQCVDDICIVSREEPR
jgi:hypothetical protein